MPGIQKERKRRGRAFVRRRERPDEEVRHTVERFPDCGRSLQGGWEHARRQVIEVVLQRKVIVGMQLTQVATTYSGRAFSVGGVQIGFPDRRKLDGVFQHAAEQEPPRMGGATVEAEGELIQVVVKMARVHGALVRAQ